MKAKAFVVEQIEGKHVELETMKQGKFGRYLGNIFVNGECVNDMIVEKGLGKPYYGERRT